MPAKVRVYELARELGLSNKEILNLCEALGIGAKSHSSSIVEAQADRLRRKAEREGLVKPVDPLALIEAELAAEEESHKRVVSSKRSPAKRKPAPVKREAPPVVSSANRAPQAERAAPAAWAPKPEERPDPARKVASSKSTMPKPPPPPSRIPVSGEDAVGADVRPPVVPQPETVEPPVVTPEPVAKPASQPQSARTEPVVQAAKEAETEPVAVVKETVEASASTVSEAPAAQAEMATPAESEAPSAEVAESKSSVKVPGGKLVPPPPGPPRSRAGKPIPPPPGGGKPKQAPPQQRSNAGGGRGGGSGFRGGAPGAPQGGGARPSPGSAGPGGFPGRGGPPGGGGAPGRGGPPGGGRGMPPNRGRQRRKSRRRRSREELTPMDVPTYSSEDAPVPEGVIVLERASTAQDLGYRLNRTAADVVRFLLTNGEMVTATQSLTDDMIELFAAEIGAEIRLVDPGEEQEVELQKLLEIDEHDSEVTEAWPARPPVVTVMGHVDHGKTLLLDSIRSAKVADGEAGGITQHIGAYQVVRDGNPLTFLDTPGHEAFTAMRARGASATDIVVLVVAADDGVMPQTLEALDHARAAEVPIVVAINKTDREGADPQRVMTQLAERNLIPEAWGGDSIMVEVSAKTGDGIDNLLDNLLVVAELEDLRSTPEGRASGTVLESYLDIGRGPVATILVQQGTLNVGDPLVSGASWGRVRALIDDRGGMVKTAGPATPVQVLGLSDVAESGDRFVISPNDKVAAKVASTREHWQRLANLGRDASATSGGAKLEDIFEQIQAGETATLNLVVKADVHGSLEAVTDSLKKLEREEVKQSFVSRGVGGITENDVLLAAASNATIIGFNVRPDRKARDLAAHENVEIRTYEIIYKLLEDIEKAMLGLLEPEYEEIVTGEAEVREIFRVPRIGAVAGCMVRSGVITRGSKVRFLREGTVIWKGSIQSLRRFKDDAKEVASGFECGIGLSDFQDLKGGDLIETFEERETART